MRGIYSSVTDIRRQVFTEVARMAYEGGDYSRVEELPYKILPGEVSKYRDSIFLERAIVGERLRLSMGLPLRPIDEHAPLSTGIEEAARPEKYYEPPLINIIKFACNACPEKSFHVTDMCQGCLAHPCVEVCPKGAVSIVHGKSVIDQSKCVKCGQCANVCPYGAIHKMERPCAKACGMDAIGSDELGRAKIDYDKCVSCGMCLVNCPFGAIADKSQIFQVIQSINQGDRVIAAVAPAFVGQFGPDMTPEKLKPSMKLLGFDDVVEVAIGADLCTIEEAKDARGARAAAVYGHVLLPGLERDGEKAVPGFCALYLHGHDAHGADGPPAEKRAQKLQGRFHRAVRRQKAGSQPPHHPQRRGLRAHI